MSADIETFYAGYIKDTEHPGRARLMFSVRVQRPEDVATVMCAVVQAFPDLTWTAGPYQKAPVIGIPSAV